MVIAKKVFLHIYKEVKNSRVHHLVTLSENSNTIKSLLGFIAFITLSSIGKVSFAVPIKDVFVNLVEIQIHKDFTQISRYLFITLIISSLVSEFISTLSLTASLSIIFSSLSLLCFRMRLSFSSSFAFCSTFFRGKYIIGAFFFRLTKISSLTALDDLVFNWGR